MISKDNEGKLWHRGTKLGFIYSVISLIFFGVTMTQEPDGDLAWLRNFGPLIVIIPIAAATRAYAAGQQDQQNKSN